MRDRPLFLVQLDLVVLLYTLVIAHYGCTDRPSSVYGRDRLLLAYRVVICLYFCKGRLPPSPCIRDGPTILPVYGSDLPLLLRKGGLILPL